MAGTTSADAMLREYPEPVQWLAADARRRVAPWLPDAAEAVDVASRLLVQVGDARLRTAGFSGNSGTLVRREGRRDQDLTASSWSKCLISLVFAGLV